MTFVLVENAFKDAVLSEARSDETNGQLLTQEIVLDEVKTLPINPVFWGAGTIVAAILNCSPKLVTPIMCVGAHQGNRYGITIETVPWPVIINHEDLIGSNALFAKSANAVVNRDKDYIRTVLQTQKQMIKVVPIRPDQIVDFFDPDGTPRSARTIAKVFEGKKEVKHTLVRNWLQAAFVAKDLGNNADSTSQLQIEPELPEYFSVEQSSTFYTDLQIGFDDDDHTFGTTVAKGIRNCLYPSFIREPVEEVIDAANVTVRNVRPRTTTAAPANTANDALLQRVLQLEENLKEQIRRTKRAQEAQQQRHPAPGTPAAAAFNNDSLPFGESGFTFTDNGFSAGLISQFLPLSQQGTTFEAASTTNPFGDTTIGTSAFGEPTGTGTAGFSFGATAGAAGFNFGASAPARAPARTQHRSVAQQLQELLEKAMDGHLTSTDKMAFNVLQATALNTAPPAPAPKEKGALGTRAFNLCGWAHFQPSELKDLHRCNEGGWIHYNKASNKVEKEAVVDAYFVQPLVRKNGRFCQILTTEFRDLIITWRLAPTYAIFFLKNRKRAPLSCIA
jgi:hypothetical protein